MIVHRHIIHMRNMNVQLVLLATNFMSARVLLHRHVLLGQIHQRM